LVLKPGMQKQNKTKQNKTKPCRTAVELSVFLFTAGRFIEGLGDSTH
jgi:hypothetical protein